MSSRPSSRSSRRSKRASPATPAKTPGKESAPGSSAKTPKTTKKAKVAAVEAVSAPRFIAQFRALSFCLEGQEDTRRFVYYKEHSVRREDPLSPKGRTMFVLNPPLHSETVVQDLFAKIGGEVLSVRMNHAPIGQSARQVVTANVVYKKAKSVRTAMGRVDSPDSPIVVKAPEVAGVEKWKAAYWSSRPDPAELKESVDAAVKAFDDAVDRQKAEQILLAQEEADLGWTLVQKSGSAKAEHNGGAVPVSKAGRRKKKKETELQNFYRHQKMEAQQSRIAQLRRKFDEDSQRMEHMRGARKFRPY